jgi:hypothetical protein
MNVGSNVSSMKRLADISTRCSLLKRMEELPRVWLKSPSDRRTLAKFGREGKAY